MTTSLTLEEHRTFVRLWKCQVRYNTWIIQHLAWGLTSASPHTRKEAAETCYSWRHLGFSQHEDRLTVHYGGHPILSVCSDREIIFFQATAKLNCQLIHFLAFFFKKHHLTMEQPINEHCSFFRVR